MAFVIVAFAFLSRYLRAGLKDVRRRPYVAYRCVSLWVYVCVCERVCVPVCMKESEGGEKEEGREGKSRI